MLKEQKKLLAHRLICFGILVFLVLFIVFFKLPHPELEIVKTNCNLDYYFESIDSSTCSITVTFNQKIEQCDITIAFYDANKQLLDTETVHSYASGDTTSESYITVNGHVDSYEIISCEAEFSGDLLLQSLKRYLGSTLIIFAFAFWICSLLYSYKLYDICNCIVIVYSGPYHHYIKVNGKIYDEHNTIMSWTPIVLSTTLDGNALQATISLTNRISVKLNNVLIKPTKHKKK